MKRPLKLLIYTSIFFTLNSLCKGITGNFCPEQLLKPSSKDSKWALLEKSEKENSSIIHSFLKQKYSYLGKGKQAHVFVSEDGKHVLKLLKPVFPHVSVRVFGKIHNIGLSKLPFAQDIFNSLYPEKGEEQREKDFQSYVNSFNFLKEETELEYLHLTETDDLQHSIELYDRIGVLHRLDLDKNCFILQKKTDLLYPTLNSLIQNKEDEKAKNLIDAFVALSFKFLEKGIVNPTTVEKNFGCIGLKPVQIDVGRVLREQDMKGAPPVSLEQIYHSTHHMKKWLNIKSPVLSQYLDESISNQKKEKQ